MQKATVGRISTADWSDGMLNRSWALYLDQQDQPSCLIFNIFWGTFTFHFMLSHCQMQKLCKFPPPCPYKNNFSMRKQSQLTKRKGLHVHVSCEHSTLYHHWLLNNIPHTERTHFCKNLFSWWQWSNRYCQCPVTTPHLITSCLNMCHYLQWLMKCCKTHNSRIKPLNSVPCICSANWMAARHRPATIRMRRYLHGANLRGGGGKGKISSISQGLALYR